jgi:hypothetical protein
MLNAPTSKRFIVLCGQIVGSETFDTVYGFDGTQFHDRDSAIGHGFTLRRSDDFNVGVVDGGKLVSLDWMQEPVDTDPALLAKIAQQIGL